MKGEWVAAERIEEVRAAARGWKRAGAISEGTLEEIFRRYPEPRVHPAPLWRVLAFVLASFVLIAGAAAFLLTFSLGSSAVWIVCAFLGMAFIAIAEVQARSTAMALRGGVEAASFWGIVLLVCGLFLFLEENLHLHEPEGPNLVLLGTALMFAVAAWRWGNAAFAAFAAGAGFLLLARAPHGRLLWIAGGVLLSVLADLFTDRPSWAPSHRACASVLVACGICAVYAAVNYWSLEDHAIENLFGRARTRTGGGPGDVSVTLSILATALLPVAVFLRGAVKRRKLLLDTGLVLAALSVLTARAYIHELDLRTVLTACGLLLLGAALAVNRWLRRGPASERRGFTSDPLFTDEAAFRAVELAPILAAHAPEARPAEEPGFKGGGGSFGGGGAGSSY